jgi:hypothetical protein
MTGLEATIIKFLLSTPGPKAQFTTILKAPPLWPRRDGPRGKLTWLVTLALRAGQDLFKIVQCLSKAWNG